ncbi:hypothetical protein HW555_012510 [Spodoptera exigua]|uniref:Trehalase n=1 Tax=Spodoptera exigua TaxID=7107 RepID=A0A835G6X5_SPOEX|nr:hypothetical protein HW555_012510 [Spodoptera exigua]
MRIFFCLLAAAVIIGDSTDIVPVCRKRVYCNSELLHRVQINRVCEYSKAFVDLHMNYDENKTLDDFEKLLNSHNNYLSKDQLKEFVGKYFSEDNGLEKWMPPDFNSSPEYLSTIKDKALREFARGIHNLWTHLGKKVKDDVFQNPDRYSLIPVSHGFFIPGGQYTEMFYWDSNWIIKGLLISGMQESAKGMIENFFELVDRLERVPAGNRWYYERQGQPPLLTEMVAAYYKHTNDKEFLRSSIVYLEKEIDFWLNNRSVDIEKDGKRYKVLRYFVSLAHPRPYSYYKDIELADDLSGQDLVLYHNGLWSAVESGWDFSSRWFKDPEETDKENPRIDIQTMFISPVDLNVIIASALQHMANFHTDLMNVDKANTYAQLAQQLRDTIESVFWNEEDGVWYDYDLNLESQRKYFYLSNFSPLWLSAVRSDFVKAKGEKILNYLIDSDALEYPGGVPISMIDSGEQWDFPNTYPPYTSILVNALESIGTENGKELALKIAETYVRACYVGFMKYKYLCENYNVNRTGECGGGGERPTQFGYGWSISVALEFLMKYKNMTVGHLDDSVTTTPFPQYSESPNNSVGTGFGICLPRYVPLYPVLGLLGACAQAINIVSVCNSSIYCAGDLLHTVQLARIFPDSKTFVDLKLTNTENVTLANFKNLMKQTRNNPTREQIMSFVDANFMEGGELLHWNPPDFDPNPPILDQIADPKLKQFAKDIISIWPVLGRKVSPDVDKNSDQYSFIYVPNGFIVPGGRFKELYYWDSYWIIRGLLISNMTQTAKGMIDNFLYLVDKLGYIPNGSRIYYLGRSQPPLLSLMVHDYYTSTGDVAWLEQIIETVERELYYWLEKKKMTVNVKGKQYRLLRYISDEEDKGPRPESYYEDYASSRVLSEDKREEFYKEMKTIENVLWDPDDGVWYDYDTTAKSRKKQFYASCATPLWADAVESSSAPTYASRLVSYLESNSALSFPGGIPTSLLHTGEQWDFPNAWPPLQSIMIGGLEKSGYDEAKELARQQVAIWIRANYIGYTKWQKMFEKYSCVQPGDHGGGGEYSVQSGFGWTNGIVLELLQRYGRELRLDDGDDGLPTVRML